MTSGARLATTSTAQIRPFSERGRLPTARWSGNRPPRGVRVGRAGDTSSSFVSTTRRDTWRRSDRSSRSTKPPRSRSRKPG